MQAYKFLRGDHALQDLFKRRLKISTFGDMNDPFELWGARFSNQDVQTLLASHFLANHGVLCFSRNWNNPVLWSHYADKHRGICLGFEIAATVEVSELCYVKSPPTIDSGLLVDAARRGQNLSQADPAFGESKKMIAKMLLTKFEAWSYEDEVRIFVQLKEDQKEGDYYFADFDANIMLNTVITGPRSTLATSELGAALSGYPSPIRLIRTMLSPDSFKVIENTTGDAPTKVGM